MVIGFCACLCCVLFFWCVYVVFRFIFRLYCSASELFPFIRLGFIIVVSSRWPAGLLGSVRVYVVFYFLVCVRCL